MRLMRLNQNEPGPSHNRTRTNRIGFTDRNYPIGYRHLRPAGLIESRVKILAIDPGPEQSAWCDWNGTRAASGKVPNADLLTRLRSDYAAPLLAIEMIASYGMPVGREVFETCLWIGKFAEAWESRGGKVRLVYRREVKLFLCESNRANDASIRAALVDRFGPGRDKAIGIKRAPGPLYGVKGDEWSALAIAVTVEGVPAPAALFRDPAAPVALAADPF